MIILDGFRGISFLSEIGTKVGVSVIVGLVVVAAPRVVLVVDTAVARALPAIGGCAVAASPLLADDALSLFTSSPSAASTTIAFTDPLMVFEALSEVGGALNFFILLIRSRISRIVMSMAFEWSAMAFANLGRCDSTTGLMKVKTP